MKISTIQISKEMKEKISSFGTKGGSYEEIVRRMYNLAVKEQLRQFLMSEEGFISIDEAIKEAKKEMAKVEIDENLKDEILKKFKGKSQEIFKLMKSLEMSPKKGKELGHVGGIIIKELKYESFRFYFITDGHKLRIMDEFRLIDLLIKFVRMSDKKDQQETIDEIRKILTRFGPSGF